jgi:hypothetical protein
MLADADLLADAHPGPTATQRGVVAGVEYSPFIIHDVISSAQTSRPALRVHDPWLRATIIIFRTHEK